MSNRDGGKGGRSFETGRDFGEGETVRILPEDGSYERDPNVERGPELLRGTLYTPAPEGYDLPEERSFAPYEPPPLRSGRTRHEQVVAPSPRMEGRTPPPEPRPPQPVVVQVRRGPSACAILAATFSLLVLSCAVLAFATFQNGVDGLGRLTGIMPNFSFGLVTTPTVTIDTSRPSVIEKVRSLSQLTTVHYQMDKVVSGKSAGPLPDFFTSDKILLVAHGEVAAGIDLSKLKPEDVVTNEGSVRLRLPKAEILYSKLDNDKTYVYDRDTGLFNKPDPNLETQLRQAAEAEIRNAAIEDGIMIKAQENAEQTLRTLITGLGYDEVEFTGTAP